ncbi:hypothetical protein [Roseateles puraquae]|jgi:hypothetical protein|uniref:Uncharacterized protein n=1 Tax=Roseateles puraquae TaxID=431059 RepID=A0A254N9X0_9BURK|nr:hypothetical protein [Roseateles puraquae]MDG0856819.1 hypothetical protein [Roseateles puraquae]OWR01923.1 hypothetical protein CDO81_21555 [Roseateles puraquae]
MIPRIPDDPGARAERKANLLLASEVMRGQAALAVDDLGERADRWAVRLMAWRNLLANPLVLATAGGGAAFFAASGPQQRSRFWRGLRWAWLAWRVWRRPR